MKIFIGADHRGVSLKARVRKMLEKDGHTVIDLGAREAHVPCDYPAISFGLAQHVAHDSRTKGILVCMSGIGHSIAANKIKGAYAALCYNKRAAVLSRRHNNANILVLGAKFIKPQEMPAMIRAWLKTDFDGGRHARRMRQIKHVEKKTMR